MEPLTPNESPAQTARLVVGSRVDGRQGDVGILVGTRWGGPPNHTPYLLVRQRWMHSIGRTTRLVPLAWAQAAKSETSPVRLNADRAMVAGCPPLRHDTDLRADVIDALASDPILRSLRLVRLVALRVAVTDGTVLLTGYVPGAAQRRVAHWLAEYVPGVLGVLDEIVTDEDLAGSVAQALVADLETRQAQLTVTSRLGQVRLTGSLPSTAAQARASALAAAVTGTAAVRNDTKVRA